MGWLNKLLSYFWELTIEESSSDINPYLQVGYRSGRYILSTRHAVYSYEDNYTTYRIAFQRLQPETFQPKKILILGYGLGSIPVLLKKRHGIDAVYTAVEIDPEVIRLAKKYGTVPQGSTVEFVCANALEYVKESRKQYDLICMDIFLDDLVPAAFESISFLEDLKNLLAPGGWLMYNRLYYKTDLQVITDNFYQNQFKTVFPEGGSINTQGNKMLVYQREA